MPLGRWRLSNEPIFPPEEYAKIASENPTWSNQRIADHLGVSEASVRRGLHKAGYKRHLIPVDHVERFKYDLDKPIEVYGPCMITADWHIPLYDPVLANKVIEKARELGLKTLITAGDFFNADSLSHYDPKQQDAGLEREQKEGLAVVRTLLETFDEIIKIKGNHDERLARALGYKASFRMVMRMMFGELGSDLLDRIHISNLDHCINRPYPFAPDEISWRICHPKNYSRIPLVGARALHAKYGMNIITAHSHHCAIGPGIKKGSVVIEAGGLFDDEKTSYLQSTTAFPSWSQGYVWLDEDNRPHVYSPNWSTA